MLTILHDYLERLQAIHAAIAQTVDGLPVAALDWAPDAGMNSLGVLAVHVAGAERYWIGDVAGEQPSGRDRDAEFRSRGLDGAALADRLSAALDHSQGVLERLNLGDLEAMRVSPRDGRQYTVASCLAHALEHAAVHLGHMQLTRQLWDMRQDTGS